VPASFIEARDAHAIKVVQTVVDGVSRLANLEDHRTLGFNIKLPKEQAPSPSIENGGEIQNFAFRKFALYENVRGVVVLPGGFGTLDELLEVLVLKENGRSQDPVVLAGADFWQPLLATWRAQAGARGIGAQLDKLLANVLVTDDPERALLHIQASPDVKSFDEDPDHLFKHMVREIKRAQHVVLNQATAVAVLGGNALAANDPALATLRAVATGIDAPLRVGEEGQVLDALVSAGAEHVQRVLWQKNGDDRVHGRIDVDNVSFDERVPHKEALLRNASAYLVLPDCGRGQDEFSSVLCQIQTGKLPRRPIVLVDSAYWQPIVESWKSRMIGDGHAYIAPEDVALISYANDGAQALAALTS
jgi:predicted Rossmann-fold nucleotide-binding protein